MGGKGDRKNLLNILQFFAKGRGKNARCGTSTAFRILSLQIQNPFLSTDGVKMQVVIFRLLQRTGWKCQTLAKDGVKMQVVIVLLHSLLHGPGWKCKLWYFYYIQYLAKDGVKMPVVIFLLHAESCKGRGENASCDISATLRLARAGVPRIHHQTAPRSGDRETGFLSCNLQTEKMPGESFFVGVTIRVHARRRCRRRRADRSFGNKIRLHNQSQSTWAFPTVCRPEISSVL